MDGNRFNVVFSGKIKEGLAIEDVQKRLGETFKMPPERIRQVFTGKPATIKRNLDRALAEKYVRTFEAAGAICSMVPVTEQGVEPQPVQPETPVAEKTEPVPQPQVIQRVIRVPLRLKQEAVIAGFWRRLFAFIIDMLLLGLFGSLLGTFFFEQFVQLGQAGRLVGFGIAVLYFGLLNSSIGKGQTVGKRLMKIKVIDATSGHLLALPKAALRYLLLGLPFFCNNLVLPVYNTWAFLLLGLIVFGMGGLTFYLYVFNRKTRQSLHDLVTHTLVVRKEPAGKPPAFSLWKGHLVVSCLWIVLIVCGVFFGGSMLVKKGPFPDMISLQEALTENPDVNTAQVNTGVTYFNGDQTNWTAVTVTVTDPDKMDEETANKIAETTLKRFPDIKQKDILRITLVYGYDIGINTAWSNTYFAFSPTQWAARLNMVSL